jgi:hypothetical protein
VRKPLVDAYFLAVEHQPESWPSPDQPNREQLPRLEDLLLSDRGYDQGSVRAAFDSFYRHAAQLDAALRTLEAADSFQRQAAALRADLRTLRASGWSQQSWSPPPGYGYGLRTPREGIPGALWRIAGEIALLVAVAVGVGVAKLSWWVIALTMAGAFIIVCLIEWLAGRDEYSFARPEGPSVHPVVEAPAVGAEGVDRTDEQESLGWAAFEEAQEPSDAMTIIGTGSGAAAIAPVPEAEPGTGPAPEPEGEPEPEEPEPELPPAAASPTSDAPRPVRSLPPPDHPVGGDPWEAGFDAQTPDADGEDEVTEEPIVVEEAARRRFRRR